ncbi:MAG: hypothetical protein ACKOLA_12600, partial [Spartobacteria bacterium]
VPARGGFPLIDWTVRILPGGLSQKLPEGVVVLARGAAGGLKGARLPEEGGTTVSAKWDGGVELVIDKEP